MYMSRIEERLHHVPHAADLQDPHPPQASLILGLPGAQLEGRESGGQDVGDPVGLGEVQQRAVH